MLSLQEILLELSTTILAAGTGLFLYTRLDRFYRILLLQVLVYLLMDSLALWVKHHSKDHNNNWVYNLQVPIESALLFLSAAVFLKNKIWPLILYLVAMLVFALDLVWKGGENFALHGYMTEGVLVSGLYLFVIYKAFEQRKLSVVIASTGMVLYFASIAPYLGLVEYFQSINAKMNDQMFQYIVVLLALLRYFFLAIGFGLYVYENKKRSLQPNQA